MLEISNHIWNHFEGYLNEAAQALLILRYIEHWTMNNLYTERDNNTVSNQIEL